MAIAKIDKEKIMKDYGISEKDTGSVQLQIAMLTEHIKSLTEHLKENKKDFSSKRGLFKMISRRRRFLKYLEREDVQQYKELIKRLGLKR
ncbi:30S ribosomal protein S15 [Candidatus Dependentiae bacterium]